MIRRVIKRIFDVSFAIFVLTLFFPIILSLFITNFFFLGKPILFSQKRIGLHEKEFYLIKIRSMLNEKDENGNLLPDEKRLTGYGKFLRRYSLDELSTLLNVIKGDMSIVGPRPLLPEYLEFYTPEQRKRHTVKPGITGFAQINGRNAILWEEKFRLDVWYANHQSLWLDCKILFQTLFKVMNGNDTSHGDHVTMPRFDEIRK